MTRKPQEVSRLLEENHHLGHLFRLVAQQQALLASIRSHLPPPLDQHCRHARIRDRELILHVDSPAWHSRMRFHAPALLQALRPKAPHLERVKVRVLQPLAPSPASGAPAGRPRRRHIDPAQLVDETLRRLLKE